MTCYSYESKQYNAATAVMAVVAVYNLRIVYTAQKVLHCRCVFEVVRLLSGCKGVQQLDKFSVHSSMNDLCTVLSCITSTSSATCSSTLFNEA
jgi:hypothetical protein